MLPIPSAVYELMSFMQIAHSPSEEKMSAKYYLTDNLYILRSTCKYTTQVRLNIFFNNIDQLQGDTHMKLKGNKSQVRYQVLDAR